MDFWVFILCVIGIGTIGGVLKSWAPAHGVDKKGRKQRTAPDQSNSQLLAENARLRERLEMHEDRLIALEAIVTDSGFDVAHQIERLRDQPAPRLAARRDRTASLGDS